ncbi:hypothetical protein RRG08_055451 [Elysia crispata]|uniref:Uncharacterized protein n=1 Tax=Elysia crispata TaxID=231223 RepID=A0AAE1A9Q1_9GAST|nr:hypothetical protein RRG08_055451 [Elysia crispata]
MLGSGTLKGNLDKRFYSHHQLHGTVTELATAKAVLSAQDAGCGLPNCPESPYPESPIVSLVWSRVGTVPWPLDQRLLREVPVVGLGWLELLATASSYRFYSLSTGSKVACLS